ncbi:Protein CBG11609 [Caenorhabditis briggsae]|uniref:Protein CBG11609 n=1 Tax=Caenorhabditis briggsae TaxID=6238 RepID=A8XDM0_CAEBR|nr:Protein CBG11609 [Caenorhabditis briggsae]CAP30740.2 Protein CBG11609 [Caenorhabditis briggsae]
MLQTSSISSSIPWNDAVYSNWSPILTSILLIIRITVVIAQRKYYSQPVVVILFLTVKIFMDYFMFEGVERFSSFPENINLRIVCAIEVFYVIMSNFIIYSTFYGDFKLPIKVIIQFSALNLISVIVAMVLLIVIENPMCYLTTVVALHVISTAEKKIGEKTKSQRSAESNFVFENAAEELMFPGENELNTISDIASEDECDLNLDDEIEIAQQEEAIVSAPASSREPSIFATAESGRPRRHEHRIQIMQRTLNRVASIECYHPSTIER